MALPLTSCVNLGTEKKSPKVSSLLIFLYDVAEVEMVALVLHERNAAFNTCLLLIQACSIKCSLKSQRLFKQILCFLTICFKFLLSINDGAQKFLLDLALKSVLFLCSFDTNVIPLSPLFSLFLNSLGLIGATAPESHTGRYIHKGFLVLTSVLTSTPHSWPQETTETALCPCKLDLSFQSFTEVVSYINTPYV